MLAKLIRRTESLYPRPSRALPGAAAPAPLRARSVAPRRVGARTCVGWRRSSRSALRPGTRAPLHRRQGRWSPRGRRTRARAGRDPHSVRLRARSARPRARTPVVGPGGESRILRMPKRPVRRPRRTAIAYLRASKSKDEQRLSRQAQRAGIEAWATREGVRVAVWCTDQGVRSVSPIAERPGMRAALAAIREHGAAVLVVARRDRIARDVVLAATVERAVTMAGARLVSASGEGNGDSPADAFIRTVIDGAAQCEHGLIRARTCAALAAKRALGDRVGAVPFGFAVHADGVRLVVNEREQATIARAREL